MKLPELPQSQLQEVLYALITRINIDRRQMMTSYSVLNLTAQISRLRTNYGIEIITKKIERVNKFNNPVTYSVYYLKNKKKASEIYKKIQAYDKEQKEN